MVIVTSYGTVARRSLRYPKAEKPHNSPQIPRVLRSAGVNCSIDGADRVFAGLRRKYHSKGAQTFQTIVSFSLAELNPDDPADWDRALDLLVAIAEEGLPPATPSTIYVQADGKTGCLHGHIVSATTLATDCELNGAVWRAGRKLGGEWTEISAYRQRCNAIVAGRGFVNHLQMRTDLRLTKYELATKREPNHFDRTGGHDSPSTAVRPKDSWRVAMANAIVKGLEDPRATTWDRLRQVLADHGVEAAIHTSSRGGDPWVTWFPADRDTRLQGVPLGVVTDRLSADATYLSASKQEQRRLRSQAKTQWQKAQGSKSLGDYFTFQSLTQMLDQNAAGMPRRVYTPPQHDARPAKQLIPPTLDELSRAHAVMTRMASQERADHHREQLVKWLEDHYGDESVDSPEMQRWREGPDDYLDDQDWARLADQMQVWLSVEKERAASRQAAYEAARRARLTPQERRVDNLARELGLPHDDAIWDELGATVKRLHPDMIDDDNVSMDDWVDAYFDDLDFSAVRRRAGLPEVDPSVTAPQRPDPNSAISLVIEADSPVPAESQQPVHAPETEPALEPANPEPASLQQPHQSLPNNEKSRSIRPSATPAVEQTATAQKGSRLWTVRGRDEAAQQAAEQTARFDDEAHLRLTGGLPIPEAMFPRGIGPKWLAANGHLLFDDVRNLAEKRVARKEERRRLWEHGRDIQAEMDRRDEAAKSRGHLNWKYSEEGQQMRDEREQADRCWRVLDRRIKAGDYDPIPLPQGPAHPTPVAEETPGDSPSRHISSKPEDGSLDL